MNPISIFGYFLVIIGIFLLISNSMNYTNIGYFWIILCLIIGGLVSWVGTNLG